MKTYKRLRRAVMLSVGLLVGLFSQPAEARQRIQGWCQQGGGQVNTGGNLSSNFFQQTYKGCTVSIFTTGTTNLISIYADNSGTVKANPFVADANTGLWFFYADNQRVDIQFSNGGIGSPFTLGDFLVNDNTTTPVTTINALAFSATPTFAAGPNGIFTMTLTGNVTSSTITGSLTGQIIEFSLCQDGTGGRTFAWPASFLRPPTIVATASACTNASFFYDGTNWRFIGAGDALTPTTSGTNTFTGVNTLSGTLLSCRTNGTRLIDPTNVCGWSGSDPGAQFNSARADCALTIAACNIQFAPGTYTFTTQATTGTIPVKVMLSTGVTINALSSAATFLVSSDGSWIQGSGDGTQFACSGLSASVPVILFQNVGINLNQTKLSDVNFINCRHSRVGAFKWILAVNPTVQNVTCDATAGGAYLTGCVEMQDTYAFSVNHVRCKNIGLYCVGVVSTTVNVDTGHVSDVNATCTPLAVISNYVAINGTAPSLLDAQHWDQITNTQGTVCGLPAKETTSTTASSSVAGASSVTVQAGQGANYTIGYTCLVGTPAKMDIDRIQSISTDTLTFYLPLISQHNANEQVLCGGPGIVVGSNSQGVQITEPKLEGATPSITCYACKNTKIEGGYIQTDTTGVGSGVRIDPGFGVFVKGLTAAGFLNVIDITNATGGWGSQTRAVDINGLFDGTGNTNFYGGGITDAQYTASINCQNVPGNCDSVITSQKQNGNLYLCANECGTFGTSGVIQMVGGPYLLSGITAPGSGFGGTGTFYFDNSTLSTYLSNNADAFSRLARFSNFTVTLKTGSGSANYTGTNTTYAAVDTTNLCAVITIPTGFKLLVEASGVLESVTAAVAQSIALADAGATCTSGGVTALTGTERTITPPALGTFDVNFSTQYVFTGDGSAHSVALVAKTSNASDAWGIQNTSATVAPSITYTLMPSN
jgi:hypothetical protein